VELFIHSFIYSLLLRIPSAVHSISLVYSFKTSYAFLLLLAPLIPIIILIIWAVACPKYSIVFTQIYANLAIMRKLFHLLAASMGGANAFLMMASHLAHERVDPIVQPGMHGMALLDREPWAK
jgi:hypothetical protein